MPWNVSSSTQLPRCSHSGQLLPPSTLFRQLHSRVLPVRHLPKTLYLKSREQIPSKCQSVDTQQFHQHWHHYHGARAHCSFLYFLLTHPLLPQFFVLYLIILDWVPVWFLSYDPALTDTSASLEGGSMKTSWECPSRKADRWNCHAVYYVSCHLLQSVSWKTRTRETSKCHIYQVLLCAGPWVRDRGTKKVEWNP